MVRRRKSREDASFKVTLIPVKLLRPVDVGLKSTMELGRIRAEN
jgi:hypothetical protein